MPLIGVLIFDQRLLESVRLSAARLLALGSGEEVFSNRVES